MQWLLLCIFTSSKDYNVNTSYNFAQFWMQDAGPPPPPPKPYGHHHVS